MLGSLVKQASRASSKLRVHSSGKRGQRVGVRSTAEAMGKFYAVKRGHQTGIYNDWDIVKGLVSGFSGAMHKSFRTRAEAEQWMAWDSDSLDAGAPSSSGRQPQPPLDPHYAAADAQGGYIGGGGASHQPQAMHYTTGIALVSRQQQPPPQATYAFSAHGASHRFFGTQEPPGATRAGAGAAAASAAAVAGPSINPALLYRLEFDGACRGNPGPSGCGAIILEDGSNRAISAHRRFLGVRTNNEAEYEGLLLGMQAAAALGIRRLLAQGDSELICRQVTREYQVNKPNLRPLAESVWELERSFTEFRMKHVLREFNRAADELANQAVDYGSGG